MVEREIKKRRYVLAFILTSAVFIIGLLLGVVISNEKVGALRDFEEDLKIKTANLDLQFILVSQEPCKFISDPSLNEEFYQLSDYLVDLEEELGKHAPEVIKLKEYYSLLEIRHWLFLKLAQEQCGEHYLLNLYFYSNDEQSCRDCETQGYVLSYIRQKYPNVKTYSFDADIDNPVLNSLKALYNVTSVPTVVFGDDVYPGFRGREELELVVENR